MCEVSPKLRLRPPCYESNLMSDRRQIEDRIRPMDKMRSTFPNMKWKSLNPSKTVEQIEQFLPLPVYEKLMGLLNEAGISSGYMDKPCLDPTDAECPDSAPNYRKKEPDIGVEVTDGCQGFATKYLDWPEELIVGGIKKNSSGTIRSAEALQTIILLMGKQQMYTQWHGRAKVQHLEPQWSEDEAFQVLEAWKREFTKTVNTVDQSRKESTVLAFSSTSFNDLLKDFSQTSYSKVAIGYVLMLIYACVTLKHWTNAVDSHGALGFAGVLLVTVAVASGLGFCSFVKIKFNAASTQILPFLALGLGVDDMFLLAHTYASTRDKTKAGIVVLFNFFAVIVIFPAMIVIDRSRRKSGKYDLLCCIERRTEPQRISITPSTTGYGSDVILHRYHNSCNSVSDISVVQGLSGTVVLPGSIQATASQTLHFPNMVTVQASASAEVGNTPLTERQRHRRGCARRDKQTNESSDFELSALGNIHSSNGAGNAKANAGASANVVQVQLAGSLDTEQQDSYDFNTRPSSRQNHSKSFAIYSEQSRADSCTCGEAGLDPQGRRRTYKNQSRDTIINENAVVLASRGESKMRTLPPMNTPRNVQFQVLANAASHGDSDFMRTRSSNSRSSPGLDSVGRTSTAQSLSEPELESTRWNVVKKKLQVLSLSYFAKEYYGPWLQRMPVKISVLFVFACVLAAGVYGCLKVEEGLDLTDVVPRKSPEHKFVKAQFEYFSFYQMQIVTKGGYDYPNGQELLYKFHRAFKKIDNIIKTPEGELPPFWLMYFRDWLLELQKAFDKDWDEGTISYEGWHKNASEYGVMAFKLLAQTGEKEIANKSIVRSVRLVNKDGIIRPETFYKYLLVWYNMDPLGYTYSQANIKPEPEESWYNKRSTQDYTAMRVEPPAPMINFSYIPFKLINLQETKDFISTIKSVRALCEEFEKAGLPNYPSGIPFIFWEQYIWLGEHLLTAVAIVLSASFVVMAVILCNFWAAMLIVIVLVMITVEVYGFMGLAGIKLSAVPAVTLILSVGVGVEFTVHMCMKFLTSTGDRNQRMQRAVEYVFSPVVDGAVSTLLGVIMLAGSDFDFIVRYFFNLLAALIVIGTLNGLVFLPVLLSLAGPGPEIEEVRPPGTASSTASKRELLPSSTYRQRTPPSDSEVYIGETSARQEEKSSSSGGRHTRHKRVPHKSKRRSHRSRTPTVDSDSSSSTVTRVTARATVTVEVHTEQVSAERSAYQNFRSGGAQVGPIRNEGEIGEEDLEITNLEDCENVVKR
ncbi:Protein patched-like 1 [Stylophora pistillata]|uniref:Protein patched-like 1 n=1 Tax=Stylophora pistillata TaxID=50429 RepID=A0A2B4RJ45_STYPI|nr:Protein patched-like 1 [Stylophora pistillata]